MAKKRTTTRKKRAPIKAKSLDNKKCHMKTFRSMEKKVNAAYCKLKKDIKKKASTSQLIKDRNALLLLLGECSYMIQEYTRCGGKSTRAKATVKKRATTKKRRKTASR